MINDTMHEIYGDIKRRKDKNEYLQDKVSQLEGVSIFDAHMQLEINNNKRGSSRHNLSREVVIMVLKQEIDETSKEIRELEKQYEAAQ